MIPEKGVNENTITCETTEAFLKDERWKLPVVVQVNGKPVSTCAGSCHFSYDDDTTPFLKNLVPTASVPNYNVKWYGIWRVSNTA